ncbi:MULTISPECIES: quinoprotein dehydrogenase-associated SoxYZ-like carrier [unclassified Paracoccus (in: a-proteobacteria)]|uniref:quinoprotein dehydrogenase-associated SoxYZ-like carrier n=1 Tax=unclassified Paracoccus (in: a-proteobacteria) TaxID=2688777 RepID=UPI001602B495|nr:MULTISPECIES: quinoprotein dehydrogenase-associated SoxYZ-like carrier [unclassified Paracoccus (in: a-proteobacteria)]MBB1491170.1 quinoprotein dehydrogenase-associated SoxYZ-like carrier [Paracoccus sp. MC1854]MBB1497015.1 quinoprotein dehydrogenase-associated SoxYZ-like carrier [Paracoccus sp. MC1862]QQO44578.1 quinoprotein dehydrogenase-associated SoxYZ-like carrier [Paracoccus sp. MC1862]
MSLRLSPLPLVLALAILGSPALAADNPLQPSPAWDDMRSGVIGTDAEPPVDPAIFDLDAPMRAENPALVPIRITQAPGSPRITGLALVIDQNPAPVAGEFTFGPATAPLDFEVRVRVDAYSDVRAIATLEDGRQVMAGRFVKASGGCAAPAGGGAKAREGMGEMRFRSEPAEGRAMGTLMIRHPNFSGLQRDQVTLLNIPAEFVQTIELKQGDEVLMTMEGGISISENPVFRLGYKPNGQPVTAHAEDTDGRVFQQSFPAAGG